MPQYSCLLRLARTFLPLIPLLSAAMFAAACAVLNVLGFACYTQFNLSLFASRHVQQEYRARFSTQDIPVELNDVVFGLHAVIMSSVLALQCVLYEKHHTQAVSVGTSVGIAGAVATAGGLALALAVRGEGSVPFTWLDL
jgi:cystinosin